MSRHLDTFTTAQIAKKSWSSMEDAVVPLERKICTVILWQDYCGEGNFRKFYWNTVGKKFQIRNVHSCTVKKDYSYLCMWTISKWLERNKTLFRCGKVLNKEVDLGEPTSFFDHVYLRCTQRQCETSKDIVDNYRTMFDSRISLGGTEKLPCSENLCISSWSYDMEGHAKKCVERYCKLANKTTQILYKVSSPCIDDHHFKEEDLKSVGELSKVCSQIVLKCLYLARLKSVFPGRAKNEMVSQSPEESQRRH